MIVMTFVVLYDNHISIPCWVNTGEYIDKSHLDLEIYRYQTVTPGLTYLNHSPYFVKMEWNGGKTIGTISLFDR
jgi:hypothetical protein